MRIHTGLLLLTSSLLLTACGGSSSDSDDGGTPTLSYDGPTSAVVISDDTTADNLAKAVFSMEDSGATSLSDATSLLTGVASSSTGNAFDIDSIGETARLIADQAFSATAPTMLSGVTRSQTRTCDAYNGSSGTASITMTASTVVNGEWIPTTGDSIATTFANCYDASEGKLVNGAATLTLTAITSLDPSTNEPAEYEATFIFSNLKATEVATGEYSWLEGGFSAGFEGTPQVTPLVFSFSGNTLTVQKKSSSEVQTVRLTHFSFVDTLELGGNFTIDHDYTIASSSLNGAVTVDMTVPFTIVAGDDFPSVGEVVVTGANGASVKLRAVDNVNATLEYDLNGDGIYGNGMDPLLKNVTWAELRQ